MVSANYDNPCNFEKRSPTAGVPSHVPAMTLAHLSDPHISCMHGITARDLFTKRLFGYLRWKLHRGAKHGECVLSALHADLAKTSPDHIAVTGDLTHLGLSAEFKKTRQWLQSLGSPSKVTVIPGNHDRYVNTSSGKTMAYWTEYMHSDDPCDSNGRVQNLEHIFPSLRTRGRVAIIGVSTAKPSALHLATGSVGAEQLQNLEKMLARTARQKYFRVMLIHHSPAPGTDSWRKRLTDAADLQSLLSRYGVDLILHGHTHRALRDYLKLPNGRIPVMGAPSISTLDRKPERRARYYIYRISSADCDWKIGLEVRVYSPDQNRFIKESAQPLFNSPS